MLLHAAVLFWIACNLNQAISFFNTGMYQHATKIHFAVKFYCKIKGKQSCSKIASLICDDGRTVTAQEDVSYEIIKFYYVLLGIVDDNVTSGGDIGYLKDLLPQTLSWIYSRSTAEEIKSVILDMPSNKSRGPDCWS